MEALANIAGLLEGGGDGFIGGQLALPVSVADEVLSSAYLVTSLAATAFDPFSNYTCKTQVYTYTCMHANIHAYTLTSAVA